MLSQNHRFILSCDGHRFPLLASSLYPEGGFKCEICDVYFATSQELRDHYVTSFDLEPIVIDYMTQRMCSDNEYVPRTDIRQQGTEAAITSQVSVPVITPVHKCSECNLVYKSYKGLKQHIGKLHAKEGKVVICQLCNKSFKNKYALKFHVNQVHDQRTRTPCPICGRPIYNKYMIKAHIKYAHPESDICSLE